MTNAVIAIAGSSGLIGSALVYALRATDRRVLRIVRRAPSNADEVFWNPDTGEFDPSALDAVDAVVNLCGVNVGDKRWSGAFKQFLRDSRIGPTEVLSTAVVEAGVPALINASAVGYYGDTGSRTPTKPPLPVEVSWPSCARTGRPPPRSLSMTARGLCWCGPVWCWHRRVGFWAGSGRCSRWGSVPDWATGASTCRGSVSRTRSGRCCSRSPTTRSSGPVNLTGPAPVTNAEFTAALGRTVNRPTPLIVPGFALRIALGEFAEEGLFGGQRAIPAALERAGFVFHHNTIGEALAFATAPNNT